jgi:hypothetical protein
MNVRAEIFVAVCVVDVKIIIADHSEILIPVTDTDSFLSRSCVSLYRMIGYDYLYVNDADGNKYFCPDIHKLDRKSRQVLEIYT